MPSGPEPIDVFISYVPEDERHRTRLEVHLGLMMRQGLLRMWHRGRVGAGEVVDTTAAASLERAWLVLLLVSADYLASEECFTLEMSRALARHERGEAQVIPVLLHACDWASAPFGTLRVLPTGSKPVSSWRNRNEAWADVARGIRRLVEARGRSALEALVFGAPGTLAPPPLVQSRGDGPPPPPPGDNGQLPGFGPPPPPQGGYGQLPGFGPPPSPRPGFGLPPTPSEDHEQPPPPTNAPGRWARSAPLPSHAGAPSTRRRPLLVLPAAPADFVGREEEIADILQNLGPSGAAIVGPAGVGKTALALRLAEELEPHYPELRIHVDLGGAGPACLHPTLAMVRVLEAIFADFEPPGDAAALEALYRRTLSSTPALVLLDNARDPAQVAPLLAGCTQALFLVTSLQPVALPEVYTRQLGPLAPDDACALARALAPRLDEPSARALAARCGFLPLAIRVAASASAG
ncbi:TIR domain-containing protein [Sorangium cellulosum]|uniref:TIR domain-containing protein n=1 Tax=Sorangium cellulosum TaxID=56 RepID=UPI0018F33520|nr:TIR domain-containing protein [Sorangium cellulosum]